MECRRFAEPLEMAPSENSSDSYFAEAFSHAENCPACQQKLADRLDSERVISAMMESMAPVPDSIHEKVIENIRHTKRSRRRLSYFFAMAASLLLFVGLSYPAIDYWNAKQQTAAVEKLCHLSIRNHQITSGHEFMANNSNDVSKWLSDRLGRLVRFPSALDPNGASFKGRRTVLGEHTVAAMEFTIDGKRSTLYSYYPKQYNVVGVVEEPKIEMGYTVAFWSEQGLGYSLISEASPQKVKAVFKTQLSL